MSSSLRKSAFRGMTLALGGAALLVPATNAAEPPPPDSFTCRASVVRTEGSSVDLLDVEPFAANGDGGACETDSAGLLGGQTVTLDGLGTVDALYARTDGGTNTAESGVANVDLDVAGIPITAEVLTSTASAGTCATTPALSGSSEIVNLNVNGTPVAVPAESNDAAEVTVPGVAEVFLDHQTNANGVITQRALFVDVNQDDPTLALVPDVIVAEAVADIHGEPCSPAEPPPPVDEGRCPAPSPEGQDGTPDKDCGFGQPSDVTKNPKPRK